MSESLAGDLLVPGSMAAVPAHALVIWLELPGADDPAWPTPPTDTI